MSVWFQPQKKLAILKLEKALRKAFGGEIRTKGRDCIVMSYRSCRAIDQDRALTIGRLIRQVFTENEYDPTAAMTMQITITDLVPI
ncbi:hypothetical protein HY464_01140 [Candidatus Peregrinibacteria bacterium]|nr:hypothetical protein [Candidatus Peregrinibacteria bacterium]